MLRKALGFLLLLVTSSSALAYEPRLTWLEPAFVQQAFVDVALKREYAPGDWQLVKWQKPIKLWVEHKVADQALHNELLDAHISDLSRITGHSIERVSVRAQANVIWIFTRESLWREDVKKELGAGSLKHMHGAICKAGYKLNPQTGSIASAAIIIPVDQAREHGKLLACIVEEITQIMGLPNDAESAFPSIFNDETPEDLLSPLDVVLLQLLYEPELKPGMTVSQVTPLLSAKIQEYQKLGKLTQAVSIAKSGALYQLIGY